MAVITFSREPHSGTQDLARLLAERLGYRYVGIDELTRAVADRSGVERAPQTSENEGRALSRRERLGEHLTGDREAYTTALRAVTTDLAAADNVVIVGHGAGLFLSDVRSAVRVFVVAPIEDRVVRLMAEGTETTDPEVARRLIEQRDRESAEYIRHAFGIDWLDPHHWDLVINTGRADPQAAVDMLAYYTQSLIRDRAEQDDLGRQQLANRIEQALLADEHLGVDKLRLRFSSDGTIILEGEALADADRARAESTARRIAPQEVFDNQIVIRPPTSA